MVSQNLTQKHGTGLWGASNMKKLLLLLAVLTLQTQQVFALSAEQKRVLDSGSLYFNVKDSGFIEGGGGGCNLSTLPTINNPAGVAAAVDEFILNHGGAGSPFEGLGTDIVDGAIRAGVNPFLVVSIALKESSFGTTGIATRGTYNAFGRTATASQPHVTIGSRNWYKWTSWVGSVNTDEDNQAEFLRRVYIDDRGLTDITEVIFTYAPPNENDTDLYAQQINEWINELVAASGSALSCGSNTVGGDPAANKQIARDLISEYGWESGEFECLDNIWSQESQWMHEANSPISSAYGIPQALVNDHREDIASNYPDFYEREIQNTPGSPATYDYEGGNPETQIKWGLEYIKDRYTTPCNAWAFKQSNGWY